MITEFIITRGEQRKRLDTFLVHREPEVSRSRLQRLITHGRVRVNDVIVKPSFQVKPGDRVTLDAPQPSTLMVNGDAVQLDILHEDKALIVLNKPPGVVMHPTAGMWSGTILNSLLKHMQITNQEEYTPGIVHRLDKDTSGVIVVAKSRDAHRFLAKQFEKHSITRQYEAFAWNVPASKHDVIDWAIGRDKHESTKHSHETNRPRTAITEFRVQEQWGTLACHLTLVPKTGRTHQLRVHLASLGLPIMGDPCYGEEILANRDKISIPRIMLHAQRLGFQHPLSGKYHEFTIECPPDMRTVKKQLDNGHQSTSIEF